MAWFNKQSRLIQILLLLIPGINWITEIVVRVTAVIQKPTTENIIGVILAVLLGWGFGYLDLIWVLVFNHLFLCK